MNKNHRAFLKGLAEQIDSAYMKKFGKTAIYTTVEKRKVPHDYMEGRYEMTGERVKHDVNHFRRLKRELYKNGTDGVLHYLRKCGFNPDEKLFNQTLQ